MVFKSEVGSFYYGTIFMTFVITALTLFPALQKTNTAEMMVIAASILPVFGLLFWILYTTDYTVTEDELRIRCGPMRKTIKRAEIEKIEPSKNMISSPALSLNRLQIHYGSWRSVLVSPKDRVGFCRALGFSPPPPI